MKKILTAYYFKDQIKTDLGSNKILGTDANGIIIGLESAGIGGSANVQEINHVQSTPSDTWTINHDYETDPIVIVRDNDGRDITDGSDINYVSPTQVVISFSEPVAGEAYLLLVDGDSGSNPTGNYLPLSGGTLTGALIIDTDSLPLHITSSSPRILLTNESSPDCSSMFTTNAYQGRNQLVSSVEWMGNQVPIIYHDLIGLGINTRDLSLGLDLALNDRVLAVTGQTDRPGYVMMANPKVPLVGDIAGNIKFVMPNSPTVMKTYAGIEGFVHSLDNITLGGGLRFRVKTINDQLIEPLLINSTGHTLIGYGSVEPDDLVPDNEPGDRVLSVNGAVGGTGYITLGQGEDNTVIRWTGVDLEIRHQDVWRRLSNNDYESVTTNVLQYASIEPGSPYNNANRIGYLTPARQTYHSFHVDMFANNNTQAFIQGNCSAFHKTHLEIEILGDIALWTNNTFLTHKYTYKKTLNLMLLGGPSTDTTYPINLPVDLHGVKLRDSIEGSYLSNPNDIMIRALTGTASNAGFIPSNDGLSTDSKYKWEIAYVNLIDNRFNNYTPTNLQTGPDLASASNVYARLGIAFRRNVRMNPTILTPTDDPSIIEESRALYAEPDYILFIDQRDNSGGRIIEQNRYCMINIRSTLF